MRYPEFLKENGTIGFCAPSFGCATEPYKSGFDNAQKKFKEMGYNLFLGENCYKDEGIGISNTPEKCAKELMAVYEGNESDVIISCGGGELMCETIEQVDFDRIKAAKPKWYMGYSDNTNFVFLNTILCDTAGIYGPCAGTFGMEPWHESLNDAMSLLTGKKLTANGYDKWEKESLKDELNPLVTLNTTEDVTFTYAGSAKSSGTKFEGRLIGGCVDCLVNLTGTKYDKVSDFIEKYKDEGIIWFLECCDLNVMSVRRAFWQMKNAGWFKYAKGFLIGRPRAAFDDDFMGLNRHKAVTGIIGDLRVPVIMDLDIGHMAPMMPLICGSYAAVDAKENKISVEMKLI